MGDVEHEPVQPEPGLGTAQPGQPVMAAGLSCTSQVRNSCTLWQVTAAAPGSGRVLSQ